MFGGWTAAALLVGGSWFLEANSGGLDLTSRSSLYAMLFSGLVLGYGALAGWHAWRSRQVEAYQ